jgi:hypothetical protein
METIHRRAEFVLQHKSGNATFEQCQTIYALMACAGLKPVWALDLKYPNAIRLITTLRNYVENL